MRPSVASRRWSGAKNRGGASQIARCAGFKGDGSPCERLVRQSERYCYSHDPTKQERRSRAASRAATSKGYKEVQALKDEVRTLITHVRAGSLDRNNAGVMIQGYRVLRDFIELERKVRTTEELSEELRELRERIAQYGPGQRRYRR